MRILKIKKGFITNSSGSYEWIPPAENPSPVKNNSQNQIAPQPSSVNTKSSVIQESRTQKVAESAPKEGLDPSVVVIGAFIAIISIIAIMAEFVKKLLIRIKRNKKKL